MSDTKYRIYVLQDSTYIMGEIIQENVIKNSLQVILMENSVIHFQTFDIFNRHSEMEVNNYITCYEPSNDLITEYEKIIEESRLKNKQKNLDEKGKKDKHDNVLSLFNSKQDPNSNN